MAVYVDPLIPWGRSATWRYDENCHLFADTDEELEAFARRLGLKSGWKQRGRSGDFPHYDLTKGKRARAVKLGAIELSRGEFVEHLTGEASRDVRSEGGLHT